LPFGLKAGELILSSQTNPRQIAIDQAALRGSRAGFIDQLRRRC
jgi:hypothetical protein